MPIGRNAESRPADVIGRAMMVWRIATGQIADDGGLRSGSVRNGQVRVKVPATITSKGQPVAVARKAAAARCH
jgi:hypothetical protein